MAITEPVMTADDAQVLTEQICTAVDDLWSLLAKAHDGKAWQALGYDSWGSYVAAEFQISPGHAGRLLVQGKVIKQIAAAAKVPSLPVSARTATKVASRLDEVVDRVAEETKGKREDTRQAIAEQVVAEVASEADQARKEAPEVAAEPPVAEPERARARAGTDVAFDAIVQEVLGIRPKTLASKLSKEACLKLVADLRKWCDQVVLAAREADCYHPINMRIGTFCGMCQQNVKR